MVLKDNPNEDRTPQPTGLYCGTDFATKYKDTEPNFPRDSK